LHAATPINMQPSVRARIEKARNLAKTVRGMTFALLSASSNMITCHLTYVLDPTKVAAFEQYCKLWLPLIKKFGGVHHGYLLPSEGASNIAMGSFSFASLAAYEQYRINSLDDPECQLAFRFAKETRCFFSYDRTFFRPLFE
jgi:hypothetical protein